MAIPAARSWPTASRRTAASIAYSADTEWTETLIPAARDADLFIAEAYYYDRIVKNHLSLKTLEAHLPRDQRQAAGPDPYERRHARPAGRPALHRGRGRHDRRICLSMHARASPPPRSRRAQVFAIAGPAMVANLTTPLIGIVSTTAIGRLGDATLLGGVAMASVTLRLPVLAVRLPAHGHGRLHRASARRRRDAGIACHPGCAASSLAALIGARADRAAGAARGAPARRDGRQRGRHARREDLLRHPHLVGAAGARQLRRARLADRPGARDAGAGACRSRSTSSTWSRPCCWCSVLDAGIAGAATAAVIAEATGLLLGIVIARASDRAARSPSPAPTLFDRDKLMRMLTVNRDIMIRTAALIAAFLFFTAQGARAGDVTLAANAVLNNFLLVSAFFLDGLANAAEQLCGHAYGARDRDAFASAVRLVIAWGFALCAGGRRRLRAVRPGADRRHDRERGRAARARATILLFVVAGAAARRVRLRLRRRLYRRDLGARHAQSDAAVAGDLPRRLVCAARRSAMPACGARCSCITPRAAACRRCAIRRCCRASFRELTAPASPRR